jgi:hypothetical protein
MLLVRRFVPRGHDSQPCYLVVPSSLDEDTDELARIEEKIRHLVWTLTDHEAVVTLDLWKSTFATVRLRTRVTKGPGSRAAGLAMAFKLIESAQDRWRSINAPHLVPLVRAGARFRKGVLVENGSQEGEVAA